MKKSIAALTIIGVIAGGITAMASPAEIYTDLTRKSVEQAYELRTEGTTFGSLAKEDGVWEQFKEKMAADTIAVIEQRVEEGLITEERAEEVKNILKERLENCDGTAQGSEHKLMMGFGRTGEKGQGRFGKNR